MAVYCRTKWDDGNPSESEAGEEGYLNLGKLAGLSSLRGIILVFKPLMRRS